MPATEPELDLHGMRVNEAIRRASAFLMDQQRRGTVSVRIVTGHGTGALKQAIGDLLRAHPAVASSRAALSGGAATLVVLKPPAHKHASMGPG